MRPNILKHAPFAFLGFLNIPVSSMDILSLTKSAFFKSCILYLTSKFSFIFLTFIEVWKQLVTCKVSGVMLTLHGTLCVHRFMILTGLKKSSLANVNFMVFSDLKCWQSCLLHVHYFMRTFMGIFFVVEMYFHKYSTLDIFRCSEIPLRSTYVKSH